MGTIPIVDIAPFSTGEEGAAQVAREIGHACEHVGFFLISGHGVPDSTIDGCWRAARAFFDQPLDARMAMAMPYTGYPYGYAPMLSEALSKSRGEDSPADLKESFSVGPLARPDKTMAPEEESFVYADTPWPDDRASGFRDACEAYYRAMEGLAARMMRIFAVALDLPPDFFAGKIDHPISALRMINYPGQATPPASYAPAPIPTMAA